MRAARIGPMLQTAPALRKTKIEMSPTPVANGVIALPHRPLSRDRQVAKVSPHRIGRRFRSTGFRRCGHAALGDGRASRLARTQSGAVLFRQDWFGVKTFGVSERFYERTI